MRSLEVLGATGLSVVLALFGVAAAQDQVDTVSPFIYEPQDFTVSVFDGTYGRVDLGYQTGMGNRAYDNVDGEIYIRCSADNIFGSGGMPWPSNTTSAGGYKYMPIGTHVVTCWAVDSAGNRTEVSFTVTVLIDLIPEWIDSMIRSGCNANLPDKQLLDALTYLVESEVIVLDVTPVSGDPASYKMPDWIKITVCIWSTGQTTDSEFLAAMKFLIEENVIRIG